MLEPFRKFTRENGLYSPGQRALLTVSGGIDSVAMVCLAAEAEWDFAIAHCNFQLRAEESEGDEAFVRQLAAKLEVPVFVKQFQVDREVAAKGISVQMAARELRYAWFSELADEHGFDAIATAHNLNDSVETFLLNLTRGTGIRGLTGIPPRNGKVIRPLLFAARADIEAYCVKQGLAWREDSSNRKTKYLRNKIRLDVIPSLEKVNPGFLETMRENMNRLKEISVVMRLAVEQAREELFERRAGDISIPAARLQELTPLQTWMYELFSPFGFSRSQCEGITGILESPPGKRSISPTHQLYKDRDRLILVESRKHSFDRYYLDSPEKRSHLPFSMDVEVLERELLERIPGDADTACLDHDLIQFPLTIRHWLQGDYFYPLGMEQPKKLSDFFVDEKVAVPEKERAWILASGKQIVWIMGYRIDHRFRITDRTERVLLLRLQPDVVP